MTDLMMSSTAVGSAAASGGTASVNPVSRGNCTFPRGYLDTYRSAQQPLSTPQSMVSSSSSSLLLSSNNTHTSVPPPGVGSHHGNNTELKHSESDDFIITLQHQTVNNTNNASSYSSSSLISPMCPELMQQSRSYDTVLTPSSKTKSYDTNSRTSDRHQDTLLQQSKSCDNELNVPLRTIGSIQDALQQSLSYDTVLNVPGGLSNAKNSGYRGQDLMQSSRSYDAVTESNGSGSYYSGDCLGGDNKQQLKHSGSDDMVLKVQSSNRSDNSTSASRMSYHSYDVVDPEDSIREMINENDFYRFVLFKKHYDKYIQLSQKYEEARKMAYYLEEKYHEVKAERDELAASHHELEARLGSKDAELLDKESELFGQLERIVRLEEDCDRLQKQVAEAELNRRRLEGARLEVVRQMTVIAAEKEHLERENEHLKETLRLERRGLRHYVNSQNSRISQNVEELEREMAILMSAARQSTSLSSQFHKGMRHITTCRRRKCSVCAYSKATFAPRAAANTSPPPHRSNERNLFSCLQTPLQDLKNRMKPAVMSTSPCPLLTTQQPDEVDSYGSVRTSTSDYSLRISRSVSSPSPSSSVPIGDLALSFIDDSSSDIDNLDEYNILDRPPPPPSTSRAFSSDSGFSSELFADSLNRTSNSTKQDTSNKPCTELDDADGARLQRSKWTSSFRKFVNRLSKKQTDV